VNGHVPISHIHKRPQQRPLAVDTSASWRHGHQQQSAATAELDQTAYDPVAKTGLYADGCEVEGRPGPLPARKGHTEAQPRHVASPPVIPRAAMAPRAIHNIKPHGHPVFQQRQLVAQKAPRPIPLDTSFLDEPHHHRWLMTTCIAGIAATLLVGGIVLGLFGQNAGPNGALASVKPGSQTELASQKPNATDNLLTASAPTKTTVKTAEIIPQRALDNDFSYPEITEDELPYNSEQTAVLDAEIQAVESENENITTISKTPPPEPVDEKFMLAQGSTLTRELMNRGVSKAAAQALVASINPVLPTKMIRPGTIFEVTFDKQIDFYGREVTFPVELSFKPGPSETIVVVADEDGQFDARIDGKAGGLTSQYAEVNQLRAKAKVGSSLYATAKDNRIPDYIVAEFTRVFSYDVDFQRQIAASDSFELFFGAPLSGTSSKRKVLHYAELSFGGKTKTYYRYTSADGQTDYFDDAGRSASRTLLKTPISGARLTSGFGMRRHPLLGYSKMHTGVDFGAASGTPIRAAGAGVIDLAGRHGAYGNTIVIKHSAKYKTLYAHMRRFAAGIRHGTKVNQGQVIGYVGTTGRSTGPHLHYEVRINNRATNPTAIKAAGGKQLAGGDMQKFRQMKQRVLAMMSNAPMATQVAQAGP
jgi:murein DD-endopeptidase MepM/ murein hydrolase activator NlpD